MQWSAQLYLDREIVMITIVDNFAAATIIAR